MAVKVDFLARDMVRFYVFMVKLYICASQRFWAIGYKLLSNKVLCQKILKIQ